MKNLDIGRWAENVVCSVLNEKGYMIIGRNIFCGHGELDIVAQKENNLYVVEVKCRLSDFYGEGVESVNFYKFSKILFCVRSKYPNFPNYFFIVAGVDLHKNISWYTLN